MALHRVPLVRHRFVEVEGIPVFYRESVPSRPVPGAPPLLLLHGFPSASHQYRRLIDVLGDRYRILAPDYPGFGHTGLPRRRADGGAFDFTFDALARVVEGFVAALGLESFALYVFDFGAPVGMRLATRHPGRVAGLIVQNGNMYEEGLSDGARGFIALRREDEGAADQVRGLLTLAGTRMQYEAGVVDPELLSPDGWTLDQSFLDRPERAEAQLDLAFDYKSNVELYPVWQEWLRYNRPPALIVWGRGDPFFPEPGARAYRRDLPDAGIHVLDSGHFLLEDRLNEVAALVDGFMVRLGG
jgi:Predicted hydrolases or acyltransferases (alpha/beta hydrolase superfamily)